MADPERHLLATDRNIVLTGFMGTGKSSVGRLLAKRLEYSFVDTDALIAARSGMAVHEIFQQQGETAFRAMETTLARELAAGRRQVIATGGRLMLDPVNAAALSSSGIVFCLWAETDEILSRVANNGGALRPLLAGPSPEDRIRTLLAERREGYRQFMPIHTSGKTIREVVEDLIARLLQTEDAPSGFKA
jgi:shikimate kinase